MHRISVLHLNVRLEKGGSAVMARQLHQALQQKGHRSHILYGYGPRGGRSQAEHETPESHSLTSRPRALGNLLLHGIMGIDVLRPGRAPQRTLASLLNEVDLIHLHAIHSYFFPYSSLLAQLRCVSKPIVWTVHDSWLITGRCAIPGSCSRWEIGCGRCPTRGAYPAALLDLTAREAARKRQMIRDLKGKLLLVSCSHWMANRLERIYPGIHLKVIANGVDRPFESAVDNTKYPMDSPGRRPHLLIVGADLSDPVKQDLGLLRRVASTKELDISLVGAHPPQLEGSIQVYGHVTDRRMMAHLYHTADALLFTSRVDNFPLTVMEALRAGTPALCLDSPGTQEVLRYVGATPYTTGAELLRAISDRDWHRGYTTSSRSDLQAAARYAFSSNRMLHSYIKVYEEQIQANHR